MAANNIFSALVDTIDVADKLLQQNKSLTAQDRQKLTAIKNALTSWKGTAFSLRDYSVNDAGATPPANDNKAA